MADLEQLIEAAVERGVERAVARLLAERPPTPAAAPEREYLNTKQAAELVGLSAITLEVLRSKGDGPAYYKPTRNIVRYRRADLDAYLARNGRRNTSEDPPKRKAAR